ncbi:hypothetical protein Salat_1176100 [Sesamum alatum]|uniref:Uncharacterized protein n=1 Tax=Sesamum alatum TaxID=300844 RepID=A0AAE2CNL3_9LAMI|nr:hypothetical protein Salat_1176100 [Sesamum alatum]
MEASASFREQKIWPNTVEFQCLSSYLSLLSFSESRCIPTETVGRTSCVEPPTKNPTVGSKCFGNERRTVPMWIPAEPESMEGSGPRTTEGDVGPTSAGKHPPTR